VRVPGPSDKGNTRGITPGGKGGGVRKTLDRASPRGKKYQGGERKKKVLDFKRNLCRKKKEASEDWAAVALRE